jgi:hypothetical protein
MRAILSLKELLNLHLWGTARKSRAAGPTPRQYLRYWLTYWGFTASKNAGCAIKDPRTMPAVASPAPATCMCCWYQQHYNPARPTNLLGLCRYTLRGFAVRVCPPLKPDEVNEYCAPHIELLYPPKKASATGQSRPALVAGGAAQTAGVGA